MKNNFQKLVNKNLYQVFVFKAKTSFPISLASHTWVVCNKKGEINRYEILFLKNKDEKLGHLYKNFFPPFSGINVFLFYNRLRWKAELIGMVEGGENSDAQKMIELIENTLIKYPYCKKYSLLGPNSNTYTQWILNQFPKVNLKLPPNAIGKNYRYKNTA